jgi:hypothetical protein
MSSPSTFIARPLRRVRAPQLLALLRSFDDALADLDDAHDDAHGDAHDADRSDELARNRCAA